MKKICVPNEQTSGEHTSVGASGVGSSNGERSLNKSTGLSRLTEATGLTRLSDDAATVIYSFLQVREYHNLSAVSARFLQLTKVRPVQTSPRCAVITEILPVPIYLDNTQSAFAEKRENANAKSIFAKTLRPQVLKIERFAPVVGCGFLKGMASTLQSLSVEDFSSVRQYLPQMTKLKTLHLNYCGALNLPASITSLSIFREICQDNRCPLHLRTRQQGAPEHSVGNEGTKWWDTPSGLQLAQNLTELNLRSNNHFFIPPTRCVNLTKLTFETSSHSQNHHSSMAELSSSFPKLTALNLSLLVPHEMQESSYSKDSNSFDESSSSVDLSLHLLSQIATLRQLRLCVLTSYPISLDKAKSEIINNHVCQQLRKITQLTSLHLLSMDGLSTLSIDIRLLFKQPLTLTNLQELKLDQKPNYAIDEDKPLLTSKPTLEATAFGQLTSFGCGQVDFLPQLDKLTHLDLSSQNFYPRSEADTADTSANSDGRNRTYNFKETFENRRRNFVTKFSVTTIQKYASTVLQIIVPNLPFANTNVDEAKLHEKLLEEFVTALCACPRLREIILPTIWGADNVRESFVTELRRRRPDIQLRCQ